MKLICNHCNSSHYFDNDRLFKYYSRVFEQCGCQYCNKTPDNQASKPTIIIESVQQKSDDNRCYIISDNKDDILELTKTKTLNTRLLTSLENLGFIIKDTARMSQHELDAYHTSNDSYEVPF